jgi:pyruvate formate lyase activating enzyme
MTDVMPTPPSTLRRAREIGLAQGLHHVYTGNVHDIEGGTTFCPGCGEALIRRDWHQILHYDVDPSGACRHCGTRLAGHFGPAAETHGRRRIPMRVAI